MISCHARAGHLVGHGTHADPEDLITAPAVSSALDANQRDSLECDSVPSATPRRADSALLRALEHDGSPNPEPLVMCTEDGRGGKLFGLAP
jgi:hypothetical protein